METSDPYALLRDPAPRVPTVGPVQQEPWLFNSLCHPEVLTHRTMFHPIPLAKAQPGLGNPEHLQKIPLRLLVYV